MQIRLIESSIKRHVVDSEMNLKKKKTQLPGSFKGLKGVGDGEREARGLASGLLAGVAVGVKLFSLAGVANADDVVESTPRSFRNLASPGLVEKVLQELRRLSILGVGGAVLCRLLVAPVHSLLPTKLQERLKKRRKY